MIRRRDLLYGLLLAGCSSSDDEREDAPLPPLAGCPSAGGTYRGLVPFVDEDDIPLDVATGDGLDGRLFTDLSTLQESALVTPNERFYIRTRYPDKLDPTRPWIIRIGQSASIPLADITARVRSMGVTLLECSGNAGSAHFGLLSAAEWTGVPLLELLEPHLGQETRVLVSGFDEHSQPSTRSVPGASWVFTVDQLRAAGAFLATGMNGAPLPPDHGAPVRLVMPGWYGCTCIKWVDTIEFVRDDLPATPHMREFASRTEQIGTPERAADYLPATIDLTAMPIRVERWTVAGKDQLRIIGVVWGGDRPDSDLVINVGATAPTRIVSCTPRTSARTWGLWSHAFAAPAPGRYRVTLRSADASVRTRRLDRSFYARTFLV